MTMLRLVNSIAVNIALVVFLFCSCSPRERDAYLRSLKMEAVQIAPFDSLDLEEYDILAPYRIAKVGDWLVVPDAKGEYNISMINPMTHKRLDFIRKGRGPGEMIHGMNIHRRDDKVIIADQASSVCVAFDVIKSAERGAAVMDTVGRFGDSPSRPVTLVYTGKGFIASNMLDQDSWYSYYDERGNILSSVSRMGFPELGIDDVDFVTSIKLASLYTASPDGNRICVANVLSAAVSFAVLEGNELREVKRYEIIPPSIENRGNHYAFSRDATSAFQSISSTDEYVYLLYSGNKSFSKDGVPGFEGNHLVLYDWNGKVIRLYALSRNISSIYIEDGIAFCSSWYPEPGIFMYKLE